MLPGGKANPHPFEDIHEQVLHLTHRTYLPVVTNSNATMHLFNVKQLYHVP